MIGCPGGTRFILYRLCDVALTDSSILMRPARVPGNECEQSAVTLDVTAAAPLDLAMGGNL